MATSISNEQKERLKKRIRSISEPKKPIETGKSANLSALTDIRAVLFDVYGTILISGAEPLERKKKEAQYAAMEATFMEFEIPFQESATERAIHVLHKAVAEVHQQKRARGIDYPEVDIISVWKAMLTELKAEGWITDFPEGKIPDIVTDFVTRYDKPWLMPALQQVLASLSERELKVGIISNSQFYTPLTMEALSGQTLEQMGFDPELLFWSYDEDIAKPSVYFYEIAQNKLVKEYSIASHQVLFVGNDMLNDVYPAQKAGFKTALFGGDKRSLRMREDDERCQKIQPDIQITHLDQILDCLAPVD